MDFVLQAVILCVVLKEIGVFYIFIWDDLSYIYMSLVSLSKQKVIHMTRKG